MTTPNLTEADIDSAVQQLCKSERGRYAMYDTLAMLDAGGISLDGDGQQAIMTLLYAAFTDWAGYSRDAMRAALEGKGGEEKKV